MQGIFPPPSAHHRRQLILIAGITVGLSAGIAVSFAIALTWQITREKNVASLAQVLSTC